MWRVPFIIFCPFCQRGQKARSGAVSACIDNQRKICYIYSGVIVWPCGCGSLLPEIKEGNPIGLPSLSHYCKTVKLSFLPQIFKLQFEPLPHFCIPVNQATQTHAGRGFEYVQRMSVQTNLHTHGVHKIRTPLQSQRHAQLKGANLTTPQAFSVFFVAGDAGKFDALHDCFYNSVLFCRCGSFVPQNINCSL